MEGTRDETHGRVQLHIDLTCVIVYSARAHFVALALKNHEDGDFITHGAWWSNTRSIRPAM